MDTIALLVTYLVGFMLHAQPIRARSSWDVAAEHERYRGIAADAATVALDPAEPPLFEGPMGRVHTALLMLSVADSESQFRADVDAGHCRKDECDGGTAVGETQVHPGQGIKLVDGAGYRYDQHGYHADDLIQDRQLLFRVTLHMMRDSFAQCGDLSAYTTGQKCPKNEKKAWWREHKADLWLTSHPFP